MTPDMVQRKNLLLGARAREKFSPQREQQQPFEKLKQYDRRPVSL
jgi:hypothetical protein